MREEGLSRPPWPVLALLVSVKIAVTMAVANQYIAEQMVVSEATVKTHVTPSG